MTDYDISQDLMWAVTETTKPKRSHDVGGIRFNIDSSSNTFSCPSGRNVPNRGVSIDQFRWNNIISWQSQTFLVSPGWTLAHVLELSVFHQICDPVFQPLCFCMGFVLFCLCIIHLHDSKSTLYILILTLFLIIIYRITCSENLVYNRHLRRRQYVHFL